ncbi:histidine kinase [Microbacterium karelineae]|uniref:histidine kinase n=1 Tax=Microbacterium karelineae TaxID=2654283 RepID=UPI0012E9B0FA|nr:histidine kinase [Microbacterium karelineae]
MSSPAAERTPATRVAVALLALEAAALVVLAGWQVVELFGGQLASIATSIALVVMTLAAAAAVAAFAFAVWTGRSWGRSGGVVAQVLIFAVAVGAVQGGAAHWGISALLAAPAVVAFVALILSAKGAAPRA